MQKTNTQLRIRITDDEILKSISELQHRRYKSINEVINHALQYGIPLVHKQLYGGNLKRLADEAKEPEHQDINTLKCLKEIKLDVDELFVMLNVLEKLVATVYNIEAAKIEGAPLNSEMLKSGVLSRLPESLEAVRELLKNK